MAVWGLMLLGCGGRAQAEQHPEPATNGAAAGTAAGNDRPMSAGGRGGGDQREEGGDGGSVAIGGGTTSVVFDDENAANGAPPAPTPSAIFWGSPSLGWKIGNWFSFSDRVRDVGLSPIEPPRDDSQQARHVAGTDATDGLLWLELNHPQRWAVDLSSYTGLTFWARLSSKSSTLDVLLNDGSVLPSDWLGAPPRSALSIVVGPEWQEVTLPFAAFGEHAPKVVSIDFHVPADGADFDLWIDDLAFLCSGACG